MNRSEQVARSVVAEIYPPRPEGHSSLEGICTRELFVKTDSYLLTELLIETKPTPSQVSLDWRSLGDG
jgi:hypothetical protein